MEIHQTRGFFVPPANEGWGGLECSKNCQVVIIAIKSFLQETFRLQTHQNSPQNSAMRDH